MYLLPRRSASPTTKKASDGSSDRLLGRNSIPQWGQKVRGQYEVRRFGGAISIRKPELGTMSPHAGQSRCLIGLAPNIRCGAKRRQPHAVVRRWHWVHRVAPPCHESRSVPSHPRPARLRPELLPRTKVVEVLPTAGNPAVLELKDDAAVDIQLFAVSHSTVVVDADHAAFLIRKHVT